MENIKEITNLVLGVISFIVLFYLAVFRQIGQWILRIIDFIFVIYLVLRIKENQAEKE